MLLRLLLVAAFLALLAVPAFAAEDMPTDAYAQYALGGKYLTGEDVEQNEKKAAELFRKASDQGLAIAQYYLSYCYAGGKGVDKDPVEAYYWISVAAQGKDKFILDYQSELALQVTPEQIADVQQRVTEFRPSGGH